jgi:nucleoside-diphosphate-sugar epimerase
VTSRVFLTGGRGFIGSRLQARLRQRGHDVALLTSDLLEPDTYRGALASANVVVHLAAATGRASAQRHMRVNAAGTKTLVDECRRAGVERFLFTSTIAVTFPDTRWYAYARSKALAEDAVRASNLRYTILRPTIVIGAGSSTLAGLERLARLPVIPVFGDGRARVQPIFVDDLVEILAAVIEEDRFLNETLDVGGPTVLTIEELLHAVRQSRRGSRGRVVHIPLGLVLAPLKAAETIGLGGWLPVTVGQLSSFRYDGVADANTLVDSRRARLRGVPEMLT